MQKNEKTSRGCQSVAHASLCAIFIRLTQP
jgi:hypothetical protein